MTQFTGAKMLSRSVFADEYSVCVLNLGMLLYVLERYLIWCRLVKMVGQCSGIRIKRIPYLET